MVTEVEKRKGLGRGGKSKRGSKFLNMVEGNMKMLWTTRMRGSVTVGGFYVN